LGRLAFPTIAVIDGFALGGGLELALGADIRIASRSSTFGFPETSFSLIPGSGGTQRLPRLLGPAKAKELIFTNRIIGADEALSLGLVNQLDHDPLCAALAMADKIARGGPAAQSVCKTLIDLALDTPLSQGLAVEKDLYAGLVGTDHFNEGIASFKERRRPKFSSKL
ncbi:hypothetical protein HDU91_005093, partial [Kappamyces sp. JEL0680]